MLAEAETSPIRRVALLAAAVVVLALGGLILDRTPFRR